MAGFLALTSFPSLTPDKPDCSLLDQFMARTILFICTGNICRSPMAEGLFRYLIEENEADLIVKSAGVNAQDGHPPSENAIRAMQDLEIDIFPQRSRC
jgi:glycine hydroxymethyltransferase